MDAKKLEELGVLMGLSYNSKDNFNDMKEKGIPTHLIKEFKKERLIRASITIWWKIMKT